MPEIVRAVTEVRIGDAKDHVVLGADDLRSALEAQEISGVFKYGAATRDDPGGVVKDVHHLKGGFLKDGRPTSSAVITSSSVDRDWDIVYTSGMLITEGYRKNPVVMPMHQYREAPIGFTERLTQYVNHAVARWQWTTEVSETEAARFFALWSQYVLNCTSIGFTIPDRDAWQWDEERGGIDWLQWELLEHSIVSIPAQQDAVRTNGVKQYLQLAGEMIFDGPSPIMKSAFDKATHRKVHSSARLESEPAPETGSSPKSGDDMERPPEAASESEEVTGSAADIAATTATAYAEAIYDTPEKILTAFESGVLSKTKAAEMIDALIERRADWAERSLAGLSLGILKRNSGGAE